MASAGVEPSVLWLAAGVTAPIPISAAIRAPAAVLSQATMQSRSCPSSVSGAGGSVPPSTLFNRVARDTKMSAGVADADRDILGAAFLGFGGARVNGCWVKGLGTVFRVGSTLLDRIVLVVSCDEAV